MKGMKNNYHNYIEIATSDIFNSGFLLVMDYFSVVHCYYVN